MGLNTPAGGPAANYVDSLTHLADVDTRAIVNEDFATEDYIITNVRDERSRALFQVEKFSDILDRHLSNTTQKNNYEERIEILENKIEALAEKLNSFIPNVYDPCPEGNFDPTSWETDQGETSATSTIPKTTSSHTTDVSG